jgi:hypothetical protein
MGRLKRCVAAGLLAAGIGLVGAGAVSAFEEFGDQSADSTYGEQMRFEVELVGGAPERLQLLIRSPGSDAATVIPVTASGNRATHVLDTGSDYVTPNTLVTYQWRAIDGDETQLSTVGALRYDDDRSGLDWQSAQLGEATVHWYGGAEAQARRFGELTAIGVERAEELLGTRLAGPVDVFVYDSQADFFGALGPGAREWTGAAAYSEIRTIFMWLGGGSAAYLEQAMIHEVTHVVFHDATDNPFHEPARWLNEGIATWAETRNDDGEREIVESEARGDGLFAFEAITEQFPIGDRGALLSYAQGTSMVQLIVERHGTEAIARIMAALRAGASDAEALEAGTGVPADDLYADFYETFGAEAPMPFQPEPMQPSTVDRPTPGTVDHGGVPPSADPQPGGGPAGPASPSEPAPGSDAPLVIFLVASGVAAIGLAVAVARRADRRQA